MRAEDLPETPAAPGSPLDKGILPEVLSETPAAPEMLFDERMQPEVLPEIPAALEATFEAEIPDETPPGSPVVPEMIGAAETPGEALPERPATLEAPFEIGKLPEALPEALPEIPAPLEMPFSQGSEVTPLPETAAVPEAPQEEIAQPTKPLESWLEDTSPVKVKARQVVKIIPACTTCGLTLPDNVRFCPICGAAAPEQVEAGVAAPAEPPVIDPDALPGPPTTGDTLSIQPPVPVESRAIYEEPVPAKIARPKPVPVKRPASTVPSSAQRKPKTSPRPRSKKKNQYLLLSILFGLCAVLLTAGVILVGIQLYQNLRPTMDGNSPGKVTPLAQVTTEKITASAPGALALPTATLPFLPAAPLPGTQASPMVLSPTQEPTQAIQISVTQPTAPPAVTLPVQPTALPVTAVVLPTGSQPAIPAGNFPLPQYDLAFTSNQDGRFRIYLFNTQKPTDWMALPYPADFKTASWPTFCGERLAFEVSNLTLTQPHAIYLVNLEDQSLSPFTPPGEPPLRMALPGCSRDGAYLAFTAYRINKWYLDVVDLVNQKLILDANYPEYPGLGNISWANPPQGFLWMGARANGFFDINYLNDVFSPENKGFKQVVRGKYASLSPTGDYFAYFCGNLLSLCVAEWPSGRLVYNQNISYFRQVDNQQLPASAMWSSDGKWLYFTSSVSGNWDIYRMRPDGGDLQNLTQTWPSDELMPAVR